MKYNTSLLASSETFTLWMRIYGSPPCCLNLLETLLPITVKSEAVANYTCKLSMHMHVVVFIVR